MANPQNKYALAAEAALKEMGAIEPVRSGVLVKFMVGKGLVEDGVNAYNYTLKACKESDVFDTSKRGHIGLAIGQVRVVGETENFVDLEIPEGAFGPADGEEF